MNLKESELIEEVFGKKFKMRFFEDLDSERAAFTHYLILTINLKEEFSKIKQLITLKN